LSKQRRLRDPGPDDEAPDGEGGGGSKAEGQVTDDGLDLPDENAGELAHGPSAEKEPSIFEQYIRAQGLLQGEDEWGQFLAALARPLPVTFRVNRGLFPPEVVDRCLRQAHHILHAREDELPFDAGEQVRAARHIPWCDGWQLGVNRVQLKRGGSDYTRALREWLLLWGTLPARQHASAGVITRQEVASMVPGALLAADHTHAVLDVCAAPGSKTLQVLEGMMLAARGGGGAAAAPVRGVMVANDLDSARAYKLAARVRACGAASQHLVVVNHKAQKLPRVLRAGSAGGAADHDGTFDRVLCDVPCSGDGTLRKDFKVWDKWTPLFGLRIHRLQEQIAMRVQPRPPSCARARAV